MAERLYRLQYKVAYKHGGTYHSPMYRYEVFKVKASSLKEAKALEKHC